MNQLILIPLACVALRCVARPRSVPPSRWVGIGVLAIAILLGEHARAGPLNVNPYGIPIGGGGCSNIYWRSDTGCGTVPGGPGTTPVPGVPMCANIAPAGHTPIVPMQNTDPNAPCYQSGPVPPLCPDAAPPGYQNILSAADPICLYVCSDEPVPPGHQGSVIATQTTEATAPCYRGEMCESGAPQGYLGTIVPDQDTDPFADCYVGDVCADEVPLGYSGTIVPVQTTDPHADCFRCPQDEVLLDDGTCAEPDDDSDPLAQCTQHIHPYTVVYTGAGPLDGTSMTGFVHGPPGFLGDLNHAHYFTGTYTDPDLHDYDPDRHSYSFVRVLHAPATLVPDLDDLDLQSCRCPDSEVLRPDGGCGPLPTRACVGGMVSWDDDAAYATLPGFPAVSSAPSPTLLCEGFVPVTHDTHDASIVSLTNTRLLRGGTATLECDSGSWATLDSTCSATGCEPGSDPVLWSAQPPVPPGPDGIVPECSADGAASLPFGNNGASRILDDSEGDTSGTATFVCRSVAGNNLLSEWQLESSTCTACDVQSDDPNADCYRCPDGEILLADGTCGPQCEAGTVAWDDDTIYGSLPGLVPLSSAADPALLCSGTVAVTEASQDARPVNILPLRHGEAALRCGSGSWDRISSVCWTTGCAAGSDPVAWSGDPDRDGAVPQCTADGDVVSLPLAPRRAIISFTDTVSPSTGTAHFRCSYDSPLASFWDHVSSTCSGGPVAAGCPSGDVHWTDAEGYSSLPGFPPVPDAAPATCVGELPETNDAASAVATNTAEHRTGSMTADCSQGEWSATSTSCTATPLDCSSGVVAWDNNTIYGSMPGLVPLSSATDPAFLCQATVALTQDNQDARPDNTLPLRGGNAALACDSGSWDRISSQCWATGCAAGTDPVAWSGDPDSDGAVPQCTADGDAFLPVANNGGGASLADTGLPTTGTARFTCSPSSDSLVSVWENVHSTCTAAPVADGCPAGDVHWTDAQAYSSLPGLASIPDPAPDSCVGALSEADDGGSAVVSNTAEHRTGSLTADCFAGEWSATSTSCTATHCPATDALSPWTGPDGASCDDDDGGQLPQAFIGGVDTFVDTAGPTTGEASLECAADPASPSIAAWEVKSPPAPTCTGPDAPCTTGQLPVVDGYCATLFVEQTHTMSCHAFGGLHTGGGINLTRTRDRSFDFVSGSWSAWSSWDPSEYATDESCLDVLTAYLGSTPEVGWTSIYPARLRSATFTANPDLDDLQYCLSFSTYGINDDRDAAPSPSTFRWVGAGLSDAECAAYAASFVD